MSELGDDRVAHWLPRTRLASALTPELGAFLFNLLLFDVFCRRSLRLVNHKFGNKGGHSALFPYHRLHPVPPAWSPFS